jgi:uncharacterized protein YbjT (DUF2867 family)
MKVVLFGATGMVGMGALLEALDDPRVRDVVVVGRRSCGVRHAKLREILLGDFFDYAPARSAFAGADACLFCLGVSSIGMSEEAYTRVTHDLTLAAARALLESGSTPAFCYVSGAGTDPKGRAMWARVKGRTENDLLAMPFRGAYMFRPAYIQPMRGVRSKTGWYRAFYAVLGVLYPLLRRALPSLVTSTDVLGRALVRAAADGYPKPILETRDINRIG